MRDEEIPCSGGRLVAGPSKVARTTRSAHPPTGAAETDAAESLHQEPAGPGGARLLQDSYPLSPLQEGMFFHRSRGLSSGVEIYHVLGTLAEELDGQALRWAWQRFVDRHAIFRTGFRWTGQGEALQEVWPEAELPWHEEDWRGLAADELAERREAFLQEDRERGFELDRPPLVRVALLRTGDALWELVWTIYHGVLDGRSLRVLLGEIFELYEARRDGREQALAPEVPFRRYIEWLRGQDREAAKAYWTAQLAGFETPTPLPGCIAKRRAHGARVAHWNQQIHLSEATTRELVRLCKVHGFTIHTLLQATWALLLGRHGGTADVVFGCLKSNRGSVPEGRSIVGPLINTLAMRVELPPRMRALPWLEGIRKRWLGHRAHEGTSLMEVLRWSDASSEGRLFETVLVFETFRWNESLRAEGEAWKNRTLRILRQPEYPLNLFAFLGSRLALKMIYDWRAFKVSTVRRLLHHLESLLEGIAEDPERRLEDLPLLSAAERFQVLVEWNDTRERVGGASFVEAFEERISQVPERVAVVCGEHALTYGELGLRVRALAAALREREVGPERKVALYFERSTEMLVALLGVLEAGGAYVPLDPSHPKERLRTILTDAGARVVLTDDRGRAEALAAGISSEIVELGAGRPEGAAGGSSSADQVGPAREIDAATTAYVLYTSGSTGPPKGVQISHGALINLLRAMEQGLGVSADDVLLSVTTLCFDIATLELLMPLLLGGRVHVATRDQMIDGGAMVTLLAATRATVMQATPSGWRLLLAAGWDGSPHLQVLSGGEPLQRPLADELLEAGGSLWNLYGPTETTIWSAICPVSADDEVVPVGSAIANTSLFVFDRDLRPVPAGATGEVCIGGDGLARGYLGKPGLTAERFVPDGLGGEPGGRVYRTGDLGRHLPDGRIGLHGRSDHQVKLRGFRIETGEVAVSLMKHPAVAEAAVLLVGDGADAQLVAYVVPEGPGRNGGSLDADELRTFLRRWLPDYMVPALFVELKRMPRTPNGKLDRRSLPAPRGAASPRGGAMPTTDEERLVARLWRRVLDRDDIGLDEHFYDAGGHSLGLIQLQEAFHSELGIEATVAELLDRASIRLQVEWLRDTLGGASKRDLEEGA